MKRQTIWSGYCSDQELFVELDLPETWSDEGGAKRSEWWAGPKVNGWSVASLRVTPGDLLGCGRVCSPGTALADAKALTPKLKVSAVTGPDGNPLEPEIEYLAEELLPNNNALVVIRWTGPEIPSLAHHGPPIPEIMVLCYMCQGEQRPAARFVASAAEDPHGKHVWPVLRASCASASYRYVDVAP